MGGVHDILRGGLGKGRQFLVIIIALTKNLDDLI